MGALGSRMCKSYIWMQFNKHIFRGDDVKASFLLKRQIFREDCFDPKEKYFQAPLSQEHYAHYVIGHTCELRMTFTNDDKLMTTIVPIHDTGPIFPEPKPLLGTTKIKHQPMIN